MEIYRNKANTESHPVTLCKEHIHRPLSERFYHLEKEDHIGKRPFTLCIDFVWVGMGQELGITVFPSWIK